MGEAAFPDKFIRELKAIRRDLDYIKEHMVDADTLLTPIEEARLEESLREHRAGKATSLADFEKKTDS